MPVRFPPAERWHAALSAAGIPPDILLNDPSTLTFQNHIFLHYGVMKKLFGLTDDEWFGVIALTTLAAMFAGGMLVREKRSLFGLAVVLAWVFTVAFVALTDSTCGFLGFVAYPPIYWLIGQLGRVLKKYAWDRWRKQQVSVPIQLDK